MTVVDNDDTNELDNTNPIQGLLELTQYDDAPLADVMALAIAGNHVLRDDGRLALNIKAAIKSGVKTSKSNGGVLTCNQAAAVCMYTLESSLYRELNRCMRARDRKALLPFFPYLRLLLTALYKLNLQPHPVTVYRGVKATLTGKYQKGDEFMWWSFGSTTCKVETLENDMFLGQKGHRTMFNITAVSLVDIKPYSAMPHEDELLLLPGLSFKVWWW